MNNIEKLYEEYGRRLIDVSSPSDIPKKVALVYILFWGDQALVVGEGKENRARVIADDLETVTPNHKKAIKVRLYRLYGDEEMAFSAYVIQCISKSEAQSIEKNLHVLIGGNKSAIEAKILEELFSGLEEHSLVCLLLRQALCSAFDGISDLKKWRREGLIEDSVWLEICQRLRLNYMMHNQTF
ncbi:hypothetical protein [Methylophaga sp.]|uniref:hypothetical protein n=1 Tax=Methylophaga sp. TaxID=2024840 RepID=UPI003F69B95C